MSGTQDLDGFECAMISWENGIRANKELGRGSVWYKFHTARFKRFVGGSFETLELFRDMEPFFAFRFNDA